MNCRNNVSLLGILGGLGPMSSVYFYELLTSHTAALRDQDHIDIILSSRATTPDRTAFITGRSNENPLPAMLAEAQRLTRAGADIIAMPCNTAHYFYSELSRRSTVPILNIIELTAAYAKYNGISRLGLMATAGTIRGGAYDAACDALGIECIHPNPGHQALLDSIIYGAVKRGGAPDMSDFSAVSRYLTQCGAERLILGCTELSLIGKDNILPEVYIDSLEVLAACTITACGKKLRGTPQNLAEFAETISAEMRMPV